MPDLRRVLTWLGLAVVLAAAWLAPLDNGAAQHVETGLKRALASFATARALNAVISVAQGTEVSVQLAGLGPTFAPGQVLDPINDLVEQFSTLMLLASVSFGVQLLLIKFGSYWGVSLLLTLAAIAWAWWGWRRPAARPWLTRLLLGLLLVRFAVPLAVSGSEAGFELFLAERYKAGQERIELSSGNLTRLSTPPVAAQAGESITDRFKRWLAQVPDVGKEAVRLVEELRRVAGDMVEHIVMLIAIFLLQTLVLPLLVLWVLVRLAGALAAMDGPRRAP